MRHLTALLIKWAYIEAVALVLLRPATGATLGQVTMVAIATTLLLYAAGDLLILPALGNFPAVVGDLGLALLIVWAAPFYAGIRPGFGSALALAAVIGGVEYFYHQYLMRTVIAAGS